VDATRERLGGLLGEGRTAEVFEWGDTEVVKLFRVGFQAQAEREVNAAEAARALGKRTPELRGSMNVAGRPGLVFERVHGRSLLTLLSSKPWRLWTAGRALAELHGAIHECAAVQLPRLLASLQSLILAAGELSSAQRHAALQALEKLPDGDRLCHGDLHPGNVIGKTRPLVAIDWGTAGSGHPLLDVAVTALILRLGELPPTSPWLLRRLVPVLRARLRDDYLNAYGLSAQDRLRVESWQFPLAAARLGRGVVAERPSLLGIINAAVAP
jgi:aminoglycoside phosphotransferase (APT) family kinase protein